MLIEASVKETTQLTAGMDYYKPTMSQLAYEHEPVAQVTFTLHNRGHQRFMDHIEPSQLQEKFDEVQALSWTLPEIQFLGSIVINGNQPAFSQSYLDYLGNHQLPPVEVSHDKRTNDLAIETTGDWPLVTFWETAVMADISETYFENFLQAHEINPIDVYNEGDRRLSDKIAVLQSHPDIKITDFGTRRHFSLRWQKHVVERLMDECPDNIVGTSNVALADSLGIKPIGTFAHEMPMVYAGLAATRGRDIRSSHNRFLEDWFNSYGEDYSIALTDTFKTDFFFSDFTPEQARAWRGVRQDSGDPYEFGEHLIEFYETQNIDSKTKTVVFSDGLDINTIVALQKHFEGRINILFGWGTTLTNDLGIKPLNVVMKATHVSTPENEQGADTVKLSDDAGKNIGSPELIKNYEECYFVNNQGGRYGI